MITSTWRSRTIRSSTAVLSLVLAAVGVTASSLAGVSAGPGSQPASSDATRIHLLGGKWGDKAADVTALAGDKVNHPDQDPGSLYTITKAIGARKLWKHADPQGRKLTGAGVTVALLDSGVSQVPGLDGENKVAYGPDLSGSSASATTDEFGHGTFMAGLIAANDPSVAKDGKSVPVETADPTSQEGLAPGAQLLSLKLAGADGSTSVDAVIVGLTWLVAHKNDNGMNVRVVNLSFGATALQPYQLDPLAAAVERAWKAGIVVVASAGNDGAAANGLADPALDPFVIAVGSSDALGKRDGWNKPEVAAFSSRGTADRHADLLAPGTSVVSLRVPSSTVADNNPQGAVAGDTTGRLFRGSGTSQATAVVSGAVALLLQAHPELTPDQVKTVLTGTADPLRDANVLDAGSGQLDLEDALNAADKVNAKDDRLDLASAQQTFPRSTALEGVDVSDVSGSWSGARWNGARWNGARWNGARWNGARWNDGVWP